MEFDEMKNGDVPEWAWDRAYALYIEQSGGKAFLSYKCMKQAFARYIAAHEHPPVDPVRELAEELARESQDLTLGFDARIDWFEAQLRNRIPNIDSLAAAGEGGTK